MSDTCNPTAVQSIAPTSPLPAPGAMPDGSTMQKIRQRGHLIAGVSADTLLFGFQNPITAQLEGFDIDVVHRIAQAIFGDPNKVAYTRDALRRTHPRARQRQQVDIVADVMTMNCARWKQIDFSSQYFEAGQRILVRRDSAAKSINDLNGKKVCVAEGSTNHEELQKNYTKILAVPVTDVSDCMVLFQQGQVDAVTADDTVLAGFVKQDPYAKVVGPQITNEPYGLGINNTHPDFVQFVNSVLEQVRADGTWKQWYTKWLGTAAPNPPTAVYGRNPMSLERAAGSTGHAHVHPGCQGRSRVPRRPRPLERRPPRRPRQPRRQRARRARPGRVHPRHRARDVVVGLDRQAPPGAREGMGQRARSRRRARAHRDAVVGAPHRPARRAVGVHLARSVHAGRRVAGEARRHHRHRCRRGIGCGGADRAAARRDRAVPAPGGGARHRA